MDKWLFVGFVGQAVFFARFLVQWICSEIKKKSYIPVSFWYLSMAGALLLLSYSLHRKDPVFILGQSLGLIVYMRNLVLLRNTKNEGKD